MRLKIIACKYTVFIQNRIPARLFFRIFLISHFGDELNPYQPYFLLRKIVTQLVKSIVNLVCSRFFEVIIDIEHVVFIHNFLQEVIYIQFSPGINDCLHFIQQFAELDTFGKRDIV